MPGRWDSPPSGFWYFSAAVSKTFPSPKTFMARTLKVYIYPPLSHKRELVKIDEGQVWRDMGGLKMGWGKEVTQSAPQGLSWTLFMAKQNVILQPQVPSLQGQLPGLRMVVWDRMRGPRLTMLQLVLV